MMAGRGQGQMRDGVAGVGRGNEWKCGWVWIAQSLGGCLQSGRQAGLSWP